LTVTVGGAATGQAWGATTSGHAIGANATVTEGFVTPPQLAGYTCTLAPSYVVNGGPATSTAPSFALVALNTVTVTNTVTCDSLPVVDDVEDEVVIEDVSDEDTTEESAVAGSEDELAATGGSTSAALLGALLVLSGAALIGARRRFGMTD
jgi:LPXTG-motif cell wall-anchored protein